MKAGVLIITRGDRPRFIDHAKYLLSRQTRQPDVIEIVDEKPKSKDIDITYRYRIGCERLFKKGCDVVILWEDDDWYRHDYIAIMLTKWILNDCPDLMGISHTLYYHVLTNNYLHISHPGRASMMSTMISKHAKINWGDDNYAYVDMILWRQLKGVSVDINERIAIGIKHGIGLCGGGGHQMDWNKYNAHDQDKSFLKSIVDEKSFDFYNSLKYQFQTIKHSVSPFLSIITRKYKRPVGFQKNQESINNLNDKDIEQIFIVDDKGYGMEEANKSFAYVKEMISGDYVFLLDDDDYITNPDMVIELKQIAKEHNPDVICFKMWIKNKNNCPYPTSDVWGKKPLAGSIGGSCFVVKKEIYKKYIHHFGKPRMGDFAFINEVYNSGASFYWHDKLMCETGKVSRGAAE